MSYPPQPPPYGLPPGPPPPRPPRRGMSNAARFGIGLALAIPAMILVGAVQTIPFVVSDALSLPSELTPIPMLGANALLLALFVFGLVRERTRFVVLGMMAGVAILFVLAAGACVLLLTGLATGP
jgi:hypothetical protein